MTPASEGSERGPGPEFKGRAGVRGGSRAGWRDLCPGQRAMGTGAAGGAAEGDGPRLTGARGL